MASSSSAQKPRHLLNHLYMGSTSAPPPTPSTQPSLSSTSDSAADTLSRLLHRLPPTLCLPTRLSPRAAAAATSSSSPSLSHPVSTLSLSSTSSSSSSSFQLGYFQLTSHSITPQLAESAESDARALFELSPEDKLSSFPRDWPLGFNFDDDENDDGHETGSFCLDGECSSTTSNAELKLASLRVLTCELEKVGLQVVEKLACAVGFGNPFSEEGGVGPKHTSLMWVSPSSSSDGDKGGRVYPYVVGLQYQIRPRKWDLLSDSGLVNVEPQVGSVLVTLGDIAQVWSNGKLKKVRGRPISSEEDGKSSLLSMTLLLTLPLDSTVSPLLLITPSKNRENEACKPEKDDEIKGKEDDDIEDEDEDDDDDDRVFNSFSFEDYAWRVYHERLVFKDPLDRYRVVHD